MKYLGIVSLLFCLAFSGCEDRVPSNYDLASAGKVALYDSNYTESEFVGEIDASAISEILARADWTSKQFIGKGSWRLRTLDGKMIMLSYYGTFFQVVGVPGSFLIKEEDKQAYGVFTRKLSEEIVIPWRMKRNEK